MNTTHASIRCQQRGIPNLVIDWLIDYGKVTRRKGADVYYFDKSSRNRLKHDIGNLAYKKLKGFLDTYVVISDDGDVITAGKRLKRIKH